MPSPSSRSRSARTPPIWVREGRIANATLQTLVTEPLAATTSAWDAQARAREGANAFARCHLTQMTAFCRTENTCLSGNSNQPEGQERQIPSELLRATAAEHNGTCQDDTIEGASLPKVPTNQRHEGVRSAAAQSTMFIEPAPPGIAVVSSCEVGKTRETPDIAAAVRRVPPAPPPARRQRACSSSSQITMRRTDKGQACPPPPPPRRARVSLSMQQLSPGREEKYTAWTAVLELNPCPCNEGSTPTSGSRDRSPTRLQAQGPHRQWTLSNCACLGRLSFVGFHTRPWPTPQ